LEFTDEQIEQRRAEPDWAGRVATAPTVAREARAEQEWTYAGHQMDRIIAPTLLLSGSESPPAIKQATTAARVAIPGARVRVLAGQAHIAHRTDPAMVAGIVREFVTT
jgi:pimeloyl-ACP methyl ester carboxylesterase